MTSTSINQRLIARQLNISPATVSKSLRNHPDIKAGTRARVLELASQMGYRMPVPAETDHKKNDTQPAHRFVGVLIFDSNYTPTPSISSAGFLTGLSEAASARHISLVVHRYWGDRMQILDQSRQPAAMQRGMLSGLVLIHQLGNDVVKELSSRLACVTITHLVPDAVADHVDSDHMTAIGHMVNQLAQAGHTRLGYVGRMPHLAYTRLRFGSFCQAAVGQGLHFEQADLVNVWKELSFDETAQAVAQGVQRGVTGWVCDSDKVAYELMPRLQAMGLRVPEDLSLTGFDNIQTPAGCKPLTTVRTPFAEMGVAALQRLLERIDRPTLPPRQMLLSCQPVAGQTVGPVPARISNSIS